MEHHSKCKDPESCDKTLADYYAKKATFAKITALVITQKGEPSEELIDSLTVRNKSLIWKKNIWEKPEGSLDKYNI